MYETSINGIRINTKAGSPKIGDQSNIKLRYDVEMDTDKGKVIIKDCEVSIDEHKNMNIVKD